MPNSNIIRFNLFLVSFTEKLEFHNSHGNTIPIYRIIDSDGQFISQNDIDAMPISRVGLLLIYNVFKINTSDLT